MRERKIIPAKNNPNIKNLSSTHNENYGIVMHNIGETSGKTNLEIETLGGSLNVNFDYQNSVYKNIFLEGPANYVFSGTYKI